MPGTRTGDVATGQGSGAGAKVFVSYAREDQPLAAELVAGLELCGFAAYLDKDDIAPGEPWEERLGGLIRSADTVVFVLSPDAVASDHCRWEQACNRRSWHGTNLRRSLGGTTAAEAA